MINIIKVATCFPLLLLIPGYVTLCALAGEQELRKHSGFGQALLLSLLISVSLSSWMGMLLAEVGWFSLLNLLLLLTVYTLVVAWRARPLLPPRPTLSRHTGLLSLILAIAAVLFFRPAESLVGGTDASTRLISGITVSTTGSFLIHPTQSLGTTLGQSPLRLYNNILGFYWDTAQDLIIPQFSGAYEVWVAIFHAVFGLARGPAALASFDFQGLLYPLYGVPLLLFLTPFFGLLSLFALYHLGRALFGPAVGLLASFLLAVNLAQIWYARLTMSEVFTQFLVIGFLYAFARWITGQKSYHGLAAAMALGVAMLARVEALLLLVPVGLYLIVLLLSRTWRRHHLYFYLPALVLTLHALSHYAVFSYYYLFTFRYTAEYQAPLTTVLRFPLTILSITLLGALPILLLLTRTPGASQAGTSWHTLARLAIVAIVIAAALYAYFVRPLAREPLLVYHTLLEEYVPRYREQSLVMLGWYLTPVGLAMAVAGLCLIVWKGLDQRGIAFLSVGAPYALLFLYDPLIIPYHPFWVRRFLPIVIPCLMLLAAYALVWLWRADRLARVGKALAVAGTLFLAGSYLRADRPILFHVEYQGAIEGIQRLAEQFDQDAFIIFEDRSAGDWFAAPLAFVFRQHGEPFILQPHNLDPPDQIIRALEGWGGRAYYVTFTGLTGLKDDRLAFVPVAQFSLSFPELESPFGGFPSRLMRGFRDLEVYEIRPSSFSVPPDGSFTLDVGTFDYGYLLSGFYFREDYGRSFRWTQGVAELEIPWSPEGKARVITLEAASSRPDGAPAAEVKVSLNGRLVDRIRVEGDFAPYRITVPAEMGLAPESGNAILRLETTPWVPADFGQADGRELGVKLDWIRVESQ